MGRRLVRRIEYLNPDGPEATRRPANSLDCKPIQLGNELRGDFNLLNLCCVLNEPKHLVELQEAISGLHCSDLVLVQNQQILLV